MSYTTQGAGSRTPPEQRGERMTVEDVPRHAAAPAGEYPDKLEIRRIEPVPEGNRIAGAPVWAGFAAGLSIWVLLELLFFSLNLGALAASVVPHTDTGSWWWSGIAAVIGLFVGAMVAASGSSHDGVADGALQGITVWSMTVVAILVLSAVGAGIGFGVFGDVLATARGLTNGSIDPSTASTAQNAAGWAVVALVVTLVAAALGGIAGAKTWPRRSRTIDRRYV
jgi:hypothetical protein